MPRGQAPRGARNGTTMTPPISRNLALAACLVAMVATACRSGTQGEAMPNTPEVSAAQWQAAAARRVLLAHQSVGRNILDGLRALDAGSSIRVTESRSPAAGPGLTHFAVGRNGEPLEKVRDFAAAVDAADSLDVAMLKLCYIDFSYGADPAAVAGAYLDTLDALAARHPSTAFVAVTVPLTTVQEGPKALVKKMLGRAPAGLAENAQRQVFNDALRARSGPGRPLFDLAALESAGRTHALDGRAIQCLDPALTSDGGHLNDKGSRLAAAALVGFLAGIEPAGGAR